SICLTSRGSGVRIPQRPQSDPQSLPMIADYSFTAIPTELLYTIIMDQRIFRVSRKLVGIKFSSILNCPVDTTLLQNKKNGTNTGNRIQRDTHINETPWYAALLQKESFIMMCATNY
ncbi:hypothetical protein, partial [Prevotella sp. MGM1]|uniref:hypothetical protein n=1 Tax=Prevotella sp. MGM1 TaxID=2033405 RepID=UPI001E55E1E9